MSNLPVTAPVGDPNREALRINVFNAIAPVLAELVQEIRRSMDYYRTKTGDAPIHEILLVGGSANLKNLDAFLQEQLGHPHAGCQSPGIDDRSRQKPVAGIPEQHRFACSRSASVWARTRLSRRLRRPSRRASPPKRPTPAPKAPNSPPRKQG